MKIPNQLIYHNNSRCQDDALTRRLVSSLSTILQSPSGRQTLWLLSTHHCYLRQRQQQPFRSTLLKEVCIYYASLLNAANREYIQLAVN
jgi:hypothetical protein